MADGDAAVLTLRGTLDSSTYQRVRDRIIKAALDEPAAVVVDVTRLDVPAQSAWSVFTSARWHVARWPDVPILLVCEHEWGRGAIKRNGICRYVPVFPSASAALAAQADGESRPHRRRARTDLVAGRGSLAQSRSVIEEWLTTWSQTAYIPVAKVVATALIENVLEHTESAPSLRLETDGTVLTVAVDDTSSRPAHVREEVDSPDLPSGLRIVAVLTRMWGNAPTPTGKTVWAVLGPENCL
ncbi:sulfate transporter [Mycobacterium sp. PS03-16]|uniref:STAS domain-containing protein n=1 Tax=Mycobacterium sp. PS03-16 TaxID=2559611 RepID=UPI0010742472|nr:STAS domain-containing protein [Mycobacterium sp. PS03-16]TFV61131.1 sulfate transporter [Mycobacterium sp. PS03-16]